jgi:uncharacterized protein YybS (DUF2232 family)
MSVPSDNVKFANIIVYFTLSLVGLELAMTNIKCQVGNIIKYMVKKAER